MSKFIQPAICAILFYTALTILSVANGHAQPKANVTLELEADPLAYVLSGYSMHAGITYGGFRSSAGIFAIKQPSFFTNNDNFSVYSSGFDLKIDYLFKKINGLYAGVQFTYGKDEIQLKSAPHAEENIRGLNIGIRSGYRFMFGKAEVNHKGFYINPWIALIYASNAKDITIGSEAFQQSATSVFPAIHVGWRF